MECPSNLPQYEINGMHTANGMHNATHLMSPSIDKHGEGVEEFHDAVETFPQQTGSNIDLIANGLNGEQEFNDQQMTNGEDNHYHEDSAHQEEAGEAEPADDYPDLFRDTFGSRNARASSDAKENEDVNMTEATQKFDFFDQFTSNEVVNAGSGESTIGNNEGNFSQVEHSNGCASQRSQSTPPPDQIATKTVSPEFTITGAQPAGPAEINPRTDRSSSLISHERFHARSIALQPKISMAKHRYWIGVVKHDRHPNLAREEKHFIWMRGNRLTCIETVRQTYISQSMAMGDIVLIHGTEVMEDRRTTMEELDDFNDKVVFFRAVVEEELEAVMKEFQREINKNNVPDEVIEID